MKTKKTAWNNRETYKLFDDDGNFVAEYKNGVNGVTEEMILALHKMDDHECYISRKENRHPEWFQPVYDEWKEGFVADFREKCGRDPKKDEIPGLYRQCVSIDALAEKSDTGEYERLELEMAVMDEEEPMDAVTYARSCVAKMPEQWQRVYQLVVVIGMTKKDAGKSMGISDVMVGRIYRKIVSELKSDVRLQKFFR